MEEEGDQALAAAAVAVAETLVFFKSMASRNIDNRVWCSNDGVKRVQKIDTMSVDQGTNHTNTVFNTIMYVMLCGRGQCFNMGLSNLAAMDRTTTEMNTG